MQFEVLATPSLFLLGSTALVLIFIRDWRVSISVLGVQYVGVFILVGLTWPLEMAVIKLITGWIASAVLGMGLVTLPADQANLDRIPISGQIFRFILVVLTGFTILSFGPQVAKWLLQATYEQILGGLLLAGMGLLHLGISVHPMRVTIGLLTFISGFEIIYSTLETSPLVAGLLAVVELGIALIGSNMIVPPTIEREV